MWMREAARRERLPEVDDLNNPRYFPYRYGHALWAYIGGKYGDDVVGLMLRAAAGRETTYKAAIEEVLKIDSKTLSKEWHAAEFEAYRPIAEVAQMPADFARARHGRRRTGGGRLNVSPELSPDGSRVIFFSEKDLFSIDLFLADAKTGEDHQEDHQHGDERAFREPSVPQFGRRVGSQRSAIPLPGISGGQSVLTIVDVDRGKTEREIKIPEADEILNPAWSADGRYVAFSGLVGGLNDLFVYDLEAVDASPAHQRRLCGAGSGLGAGRKVHRDQHRPLHDESRQARLRPDEAGSGRRGVRRGEGVRRLREREEHQPAVHRRRPRGVLHLRSPGRLEHLPAGDRRATRPRRSPTW